VVWASGQLMCINYQLICKAKIKIAARRWRRELLFYRLPPRNTFERGNPVGRCHCRLRNFNQGKRPRHALIKTRPFNTLSCSILMSSSLECARGTYIKMPLQSDGEKAGIVWRPIKKQLSSLSSAIH
jgi:hypothetical protein